MSFTSAQQARILHGVYEISAKLTSSRVTQSVDMLDSTTLNDTAKRSVAGVASGEWQVEGWADTEAYNQTFAQQAFWYTLNTDVPTSYAPAGFTVGNPVELVTSRLPANFEIGSAVGGLSNFSMTVQGDGPVAQGVSLHGITAETADGNGTTYDRGVTSTGLGAVAHIHTTAFSGLTSNVVIVEDSANASAWSTIGTFTTVTAAGFQRLSISGTVRRYIRCSWDVTGTGTTTFAVAVAPL